jgi:LuxR family maltose regulon positive regulatory protein
VARDGSATHCNEQSTSCSSSSTQGLRRPSTAIAPVTSAELRVLVYLPTHLSMQEIADELVISRNTVKSHAVAIYRKLGARRERAVAELASSACSTSDAREPAKIADGSRRG